MNNPEMPSSPIPTLTIRSSNNRVIELERECEREQRRFKYSNTKMNQFERTDVILHDIEHNIGLKEDVGEDCPLIIDEEENPLQPLTKLLSGEDKYHPTGSTSTHTVTSFADQNHDSVCHFYTTSGMPLFSDLDTDFAIHVGNDMNTASTATGAPARSYPSSSVRSSNRNGNIHENVSPELRARHNLSPPPLAPFTDMELWDCNDVIDKSNTKFQYQDQRHDYQTMEVADNLDDDTMYDEKAGYTPPRIQAEFSWEPQKFNPKDCGSTDGDDSQYRSATYGGSISSSSFGVEPSLEMQGVGQLRRGSYVQMKEEEQQHDQQAQFISPSIHMETIISTPPKRTGERIITNAVGPDTTEERSLAEMQPFSSISATPISSNGAHTFFQQSARYSTRCDDPRLSHLTTDAHFPHDAVERENYYNAREGNCIAMGASAIGRPQLVEADGLLNYERDLNINGRYENTADDRIAPVYTSCEVKEEEPRQYVADSTRKSDLGFVCTFDKNVTPESFLGGGGDEEFSLSSLPSLVEEGEGGWDGLKFLQQNAKEPKFSMQGPESIQGRKVGLVSPLPCNMPPTPVKQLPKTVNAYHTPLKKKKRVKDESKAINDRIPQQKKCKSQSHQTPFPETLHKMITEAVIAYPLIMRWICDGEAFIINNSTNVFDVNSLKSILSTHFNHGNLSSLVRQLNMYGFHKHTEGKYEGAFYHQYFCRDIDSPYCRLDLIERSAKKTKNKNNPKKIQKSTKRKKKDKDMRKKRGLSMREMKQNHTQIVNDEIITTDIAVTGKASEKITSARVPSQLPQSRVLCSTSTSPPVFRSHSVAQPFSIPRKKRAASELLMRAKMQNDMETVNDGAVAAGKESGKAMITRAPLPLPRSHVYCSASTSPPVSRNHSIVQPSIPRKKRKISGLPMRAKKEKDKQILNRGEGSVKTMKERAPLAPLSLPQSRVLCSASTSPLISSSHTTAQPFLIPRKKRKAFLTACKELKKEEESDKSSSHFDSDYDDELPIKTSYAKKRRRVISSAGSDTNSHLAALKHKSTSSQIQFSKKKEDDDTDNDQGSQISSCTADLLCNETLTLVEKEDGARLSFPSFVTPPRFIAFAEKLGFRMSV
eukprot:CAMPEP_0198262268 /NCGR_PEP_ID=MMETSP1447-20131203/10803_1 /TAXON_ID=420782 /ORGANISM="Chaetoceros dichaeta, Strain CCMP1751" /LENGTH=1105 /DNA_ID=CAMNT_0043950451 /DNA_START=13 /DNA_END=3333 /DNA_ORIENTATION=+